MTQPRHQATILVADDDSLIRTNLRVLLQSEGYRVVEAVNGLQAAQAFGDAAVALVLLDLQMPGRDGMDVLRQHQDRLAEMPVIVITGVGSAAALEAMKLGAFDYLTKPFDLEEVLFTVRRALMQKALPGSGGDPGAGPSDPGGRPLPESPVNGCCASRRQFFDKIQQYGLQS